MDHLASILPTVLGKRGLKDHAQAALVVHRAQLWVGGRLASLKELLTVRKLEDGTLFIACGHSIALQECQAIVPELLAYLQKECRFSSVRSIRLARN